MATVVFCPVCCGEYLLGEVFNPGQVPQDIPSDELMVCPEATIVCDAGKGTVDRRSVVVRLPKVGKAAVDDLSGVGQVALICRECYAIEPVDERIVHVVDNV
ncbi:hypothetical protein [Alicyclobacillus herbarius]|uniref:hypothetical protein n=1 Tax=Alicyclobacillus herbarius TaxID=122960 RepID=UPI0003F57987|nr:hypothetical protein [Alicyclobacillus herbarius]